MPYFSFCVTGIDLPSFVRVIKDIHGLVVRLPSHSEAELRSYPGLTEVCSHHQATLDPTFAFQLHEPDQHWRYLVALIGSLPANSVLHGRVSTRIFHIYSGLHPLEDHTPVSIFVAVGRSLSTMYWGFSKRSRLRWSTKQSNQTNNSESANQDRHLGDSDSSRTVLWTTTLRAAICTSFYDEFFSAYAHWNYHRTIQNGDRSAGCWQTVWFGTSPRTKIRKYVDNPNQQMIYWSLE